jgi:hypothetical protein
MTEACDSAVQQKSWSREDPMIEMAGKLSRVPVEVTS